ncbi:MULTISPECIES: hypothetical protein [Microbacterium]|uniref:hypothetical protein n=1 Tax=Microbacterium TaxID=33882 RepID=UPI00146DDE11|nr:MULTISPECIES: hypothetical protein [Microbacterium]
MRRALGTRDGRLVFIIGGALITVSALGGLVGAVALYATVRSLSTGGPIGGGEGSLFADALLRGMFAAAVVLFAVGIRGEGSVVGRRPVGTIALIATAVAWMVPILPSALPAESSLVWFAVGQWGVVVAGTVAAVEVIRLRAVRGWTRFLPLALVVAQLALQLSMLVILTAPLDSWSRLGWAAMLGLFGYPAVTLITLAIGICALVAGLRARPSDEVSSEFTEDRGRATPAG